MTDTIFNSNDFHCVLSAWHKYEKELRLFLLKETHTHDKAEDIVQKTFLKSMKEGQKFCSLDNPKAWLFRVAKNALIDNVRLQKNEVEPDLNLVHEANPNKDPITELNNCIIRNLSELDEVDREIIEQCDLEGLRQQQFADQAKLTLSATKSRLKRARQRLRDNMSAKCQVQYDESGSICCHTPRK